jgi:hypothetical protein
MMKTSSGGGGVGGRNTEPPSHGSTAKARAGAELEGGDEERKTIVAYAPEE